MSNTTPEFLKRHQIVRAGAGAGKTYTLTHKVMDIADAAFKKDGRWPRVVVTTFTRKATQELRERLMLLALEEKPHLVEFVNSRSHLMVSTIHGVMDLFLKRYGANICVDPGYAVVTGAQATKLARQILRHSILEEGGDSGLLETFSFNLLTTLMRNLDSVYNQDPKARPYTVADFQEVFAKRSLTLARDLESAAFNIKEESSKDSWLKMADAYQELSKILKRGDWQKNHASFVNLLKSMGNAPPYTAKNPPVTEATRDDAKVARENAKKLLDAKYDPEVWKSYALRFETLERIGRRFSEEFRKAKRERGWLEINDLELLVMDCVRSHPESSKAFSEEWDHWLIDEYQDTSPFQVKLLKELTGQEPCFVVGDPQQSIYLFRGARSEVFGQREDEIVEGGGEIKLLTVNRRSHPELLLFLNDFFGGFNPPFKRMEPFLEGDRQIDAAKVVAEIFIAGDQPGGDEDDDAEEGESDETTASAEEKVENFDEMRTIVARVQDLLEKGARPDEICVLARTNGTLTEVAEWLSKYGLPAHVHAAAGFFDRRETRDALALLKFLVNPHDNFNLIELLRSPFFRVPDRTLVELTKKRPPSIWETLIAERSLSDEMNAVRKLERLSDEVEEFGLTGTFKKGLLESGFIDLSHVHDTSGRRESNIWKLLARLEAEEGRSGFNPLAFVVGTTAELKIEEGGGEGDAVAAVEPDRINLMTVHASKGLEFKHVILPRMHQKPRLTASEEFVFESETGLWSASLPYGDDAKMTGTLAESVWVEKFKQQELEEHARVLYVALTRAVETVFLSWTEPRGKNSWADMVHIDLAQGAHPGQSYSYVVHHEALEPKAAREFKNVKVDVRERWLKEPKADNALGVLPGSEAPTSLSVTEMLDRKPGLVLSSDSSRDVNHRLKIAATGTAVHKLMELLKYPSREVMNQLVAKWFPNQEDKVLKSIEFVKSSTNPPLLDIISSGEVEWGFAMIEHGILIEGQVDLWGRAPDGTPWIIDYKTGNPEMRTKAFEQMALYTLALRKSGAIGANEKLKLAAVYPFAEKIYIEDEPTYDSILEMFGLQHLT